ncbi:hypothetical protein QEG98_40755 [Myxococcus sp. MxC21-1]|uniref:hypothetical protein n=1 Tax=Myxococcus sp. MxC21-1 TaxID=3041439 RepID=UPI00292FC0CB|nr:hypothetical protein [Myxococcus sp. MxC21-1]WNZ62082.1 hypothetical protein QEG98_40755 [Myxococcus sp. MxC21-1]
MQGPTVPVQEFSEWNGQPFFDGYPPKGRVVYIVKSEETETFKAYGAMDDSTQAIFAVQGSLSELDGFVAQMNIEGARVLYQLPPFSTDTNTGGDPSGSATTRSGRREETK